jgi:hypothetical protein
MRGWINEHLGGEQRAWADRNLGLVEASISRMVPPLTPEQLAEDPLLVRVDPSSELPVDSAAFRGEIPALNGIIPYTPFEFYMMRKLFLNNGSHALCAYLGYERGMEYIWQAIEDPEIRAAARASPCAALDRAAGAWYTGAVTKRRHGRQPHRPRDRRAGPCTARRFSFPYTPVRWIPMLIRRGWPMPYTWRIRVLTGKDSR